jgi:NAD(P)-dependent dehydrogenase (short-subunit alcohol dehydrogenase family)
MSNRPVALVTGAGGGIGAASSAALAGKGFAVVVTDIDVNAADRVACDLQNDGGSAVAVGLDVSDESSWRAAVRTAEATFGPITVLHNNAGLTSAAVNARDLRVEHMDVDLWDQVMAVTLRGSMLGCKHVVPAMMSAGGGSIVMTASVKGSTGSELRTAYSTAKSGLAGLIRTVAAGYGRYGIRCNAIAPGIIDTDGFRSNAQPATVRALEADTLLPRLGRAEDIAAMVAFLATDDGSFVTGQWLVVDGGLTSHTPALSPVAGV